MGSWSKDDENGNANGKKAIGFDKQNKNYAPVSLLLYISLPSLHDVPQRQTSYLILRLKEEANTRRGLYFFPSYFPSFSLSLFFFNSDTVLDNSTPENSPTFDKLNDMKDVL